MKRNLIIIAAMILITGCSSQAKQTDQNTFDEYVQDETDDKNSEDILQKEQQGDAQSESTSITESQSGLNEDRIIQEQSSQVELNDWGEVRFVSCEPDSSPGADPLEDVSFYLVKDEEILYEFPYTGPDHTSGYGLYYDITFVMFMDTNQDGRKDVVIGAEYMTGAGPQGAIPHTVVKVYEDSGGEFIYQKELCEEINGNLSWESEYTAADIRQMIQSISSAGEEETVLPDEEQTNGITGSYEDYSGRWSELGISYEELLENGGLEMTCRVCNGNEFSGEVFAVQGMTQRIASIEGITGIIENGVLSYPFTDDGWGGTGTLCITFLPDGISIEVLDYKMAEENRIGYGISGSYELIREE